MLYLAPGEPLDVPAIQAWLDPIASVAKLAITPYGDGPGDVWTRTRAALQRLVDGERYAAQTPPARRVLAAATILHAIGKPHVMPGTPGYATRGDTLARAALWRDGAGFSTREHVCALIRHHGVPSRGLDSDNPVRLARWISLITRHDWLVAVADAVAPSDEVALWAEHCRELEILDRPQPFASRHTRIAYLESPSRQPDVVAHDDTECEVVVMCGLPPSGKSTWLATNVSDMPLVSLDDLRIDLDVAPNEGQGAVIDAAREQARGFLREHRSFVWNATNLTRLHRTQIVELIRSYRGRARMVYCEVSAAELAQRNRSRDAAVPEAAIRRMIERWTVPDPSEAHDVTYVVARGDGVTWPPASW
jgi:predicted kinase